MTKTSAKYAFIAVRIGGEAMDSENQQCYGYLTKDGQMLGGAMPVVFGPVGRPGEPHLTELPSIHYLTESLKRPYLAPYVKSVKVL